MFHFSLRTVTPTVPAPFTLAVSHPGPPSPPCYLDYCVCPSATALSLTLHCCLSPKDCCPQVPSACTQHCLSFVPLINHLQTRCCLFSASLDFALQAPSSCPGHPLFLSRAAAIQCPTCLLAFCLLSLTALLHFRSYSGHKNSSQLIFKSLSSHHFGFPISSS